MARDLEPATKYLFRIRPIYVSPANKKDEEIGDWRWVDGSL